jgi:hypothetical protein
MNWKEQLDKAVAAVREAATSEKAQEIASKAKATATSLVEKAKTGAVDAAEAFVEANRDPSALSVRFLNVDLTIVSPAAGISVTRHRLSSQRRSGRSQRWVRTPTTWVQRMGSTLS